MKGRSAQLYRYYVENHLLAGYPYQDGQRRPVYGSVQKERSYEKSHQDHMRFKGREKELSRSYLWLRETY